MSNEHPILTEEVVSVLVPFIMLLILASPWIIIALCQ